MRVFLVCALLVGVATLGMAAGCSDNGVGRRCEFAGGDGGISGTTISTPSLECFTRLCYLKEGQMGGAPRQVCTAKCNTDDDCKPNLIGESSRGFCPTKFVCAVASPAGNFKCQKLCICHDDLQTNINSDADGGVMCPNACGGHCLGVTQ